MRYEVRYTRIDDEGWKSNIVLHTSNITYLTSCPLSFAHCLLLFASCFCPLPYFIKNGSTLPALPFYEKS